MGEYSSSYGILAKKADRVIDLHREHTSYRQNYILDEWALPFLSEIFKKNENKAVFIHLSGNHKEYRQRYPHPFEQFNSNDAFFEGKELTQKQKKIISEYDNSVLYNDFIVSSIIDSTRKYTDFSYVLYFPDHGEDVFDVGNWYGHSFAKASKTVCNIPFILWRSEEFKKQLNISEKNTDKPYSIEDAIHAISQLSGLDYEDYDATKSIFSDEFAEKKRKVHNMFYDDLP
jgi:heptose-I-phosphate ethanolaminephosphotransferase